jgi:hypothetical protein
MQTTVMAPFSLLWLSRLMMGLTPLPLQFAYLLSDASLIPDDTPPALTPVAVIYQLTVPSCNHFLQGHGVQNISPGVAEAADLLKLLLDADCHNDWSLTIGHSLLFV